MSTQPGSEPVEEDEILYRRIPVSTGWYSASGLSPEAFDPRPDEVSGISLYRAKYKQLEEAAKGRSKKGYYVAVFRAGDLFAQGIQVSPRPSPNDAGHAELPQLTCDNRETDEAINRKMLLSTLPLRIEGPFIP
jgi:hypothetical protein